MLSYAMVTHKHYYLLHQPNEVTISMQVYRHVFNESTLESTSLHNNYKIISYYVCQVIIF